MPLMWLSLAFVLGILLADRLPVVPPAAWLAGAVVAVLLAALERRWRRLPNLLRRWRTFTRLPLAALLAAVLLGAACLAFDSRPPTPADLSWYNDRGSITLQGVIDSPPEPGDALTTARLRVDRVLRGTETLQVSGRVQVDLPAGSNWRYGDRLELNGHLETPWEGIDFSYREYLQRQGVTSYLRYPRTTLLERNQGNPIIAAVFALRQRAYERIRLMLPMPESALLSGILLGMEEDLPPEYERAFRQTGTAHIIAISGFNIAILAGLFALLFGRIIPNRWWALLVTVVAIAFYTVMVGGQASVVRAAIMGAVGLLGVQIGRRQAGLNSLAFTAAAMCLFNPQLPWDAGFQLSFTATLGLVLFGEPLQAAAVAWLEQRMPPATAARVAEPLSEYLLMTLAAQLTTLPVVAAHFRQIPLISLVANPLVLPAQPLVMVLGGIATIAGLIWLPLGRLLAALAWPLLAYTGRVAEWLADAPLATVSLGESAWGWALLFYAGLLLVSPVVRSWFGIRFRVAPALVIVASGLLAAVLWRSVASLPDGRLNVTVLDMPGTPAVWIRTPGGQTVLVNGGSSSLQLGDAISRRAPPVGARIDWMVTTRSNQAAFSGLPGLASRLPVGSALLYAPGLEGSTGRRLEDALYARGALVTPYQAQRCLQQDALQLCAQDEGDDAAVFWLEYGNFRLLGGAAAFDGDGLPPVEGAVLLLLDEVDPEVLQSLRQAAPLAIVLAEPAEGCPECISLPQVGWVAFSTDGEKMTVQSGK